MTLPTGRAHFCFDATALIYFAKAERLDLLGEWFPEAFTPEVVMEEELRAHVAKYPENQDILDAAWLTAVPVERDEDLRLVAALHKRWGSRVDQNRGEAEVVALCKRHGWTGVIDDTLGQQAIRDEKLTSCSILTVILAAAASGKLTENEAWDQHCQLDALRGGGRSALTAQPAHRDTFRECVRAFRELNEHHGDRDWPWLLGRRGLDAVVLKVRASDWTGPEGQIRIPPPSRKARKRRKHS